MWGVVFKPEIQADCVLETQNTLLIQQLAEHPPASGPPKPELKPKRDTVSSANPDYPTGALFRLPAILGLHSRISTFRTGNSLKIHKSGRGTRLELQDDTWNDT